MEEGGEKRICWKKNESFNTHNTQHMGKSHLVAFKNHPILELSPNSSIS